MTDQTNEPQKDVLLPREVGRMFRCDPKTVSRWAKTGKLVGFRTPGGHLRFRREVVEKALAEAGLGIE